MDILITICARGGSKGVKNKNIRLLLGQPLIAHTIKQALGWSRATDVVVSTDSQEIADVARECGAKVPFMRSQDLATDNSPKLPVIRDTLLRCEKLYKKKYDIVVDLDATSPLRKISDIENCYKTFISKDSNTLFSVVNAHRNPYFNMVEDGEDGYVRLCKRLNSDVIRRQDAPKVYDMNASIYFYKRSYVFDEKNKSAISERSSIYVMDDASSYDIDREIDFHIVEFFLNRVSFDE